jgi:hypothetical protein
LEAAENIPFSSASGGVALAGESGAVAESRAAGALAESRGGSKVPASGEDISFSLGLTWFERVWLQPGVSQIRNSASTWAETPVWAGFHPRPGSIPIHADPSLSKQSLPDGVVHPARSAHQEEEEAMSPNLDSAIKSQVSALLLRRLFGASRRDEALEILLLFFMRTNAGRKGQPRNKRRG